MIEAACDHFKGMIVTNGMRNQIVAKPFLVCKDNFGTSLKCTRDILEQMLVRRRWPIPLVLICNEHIFQS